MNASVLKAGRAVMGFFSASCTILPMYYFVGYELHVRQEAADLGSVQTSAFQSMQLLDAAIQREQARAASAPAAERVLRREALAGAEASWAGAWDAWTAGDYRSCERQAADGRAALEGRLQTSVVRNEEVRPSEFKRSWLWPAAGLAALGAVGIGVLLAGRAGPQEPAGPSAAKADQAQP